MRTSADQVPSSEGRRDQYASHVGMECLLKEAIDHLRQGVILVDRFSHIIFANRMAQTILAARDWLHDGPTGLRAETIELTRRFRCMVEIAAGAASASALIALPCHARAHPVSVLVRPVCSGVALVLVVDPDLAATLSPDDLRRLYGLTDAEAAVAVAVAAGEGLAAAAAKLDVGITTARTHLQHVFQKTGTRRQAQLVRLIVAGCFGLGA